MVIIIFVFLYSVIVIIIIIITTTVFFADSKKWTKRDGTMGLGSPSSVFSLRTKRVRRGGGKSHFSLNLKCLLMGI